MNGPALLLIHGYPFDHSLWGPVLPLLRREARVFAPDLRGFGGQAIGRSEPSLDIMADDLSALLDQEGVARAVIAGMSMGGYVALALAERHPGFVAGLALISSQTVADTEEARSGRRSMIQKIRQEGAGAAAVAAIPKLFAAGNSSRVELRKYPEQGAQKAGVDGLSWALEAMARRPDRTRVLEECHLPILLVQGLEDKFVPAEQTRSLAARLKNTTYLELAGAGHATPLEAPVPLAEALNELLCRSFGLT